MSKKDSYKSDIQIEDYGTSISNPVLLSSIRAGYNFCDKLKNLDEDLEYTRRGSNYSPGFDKPVDAYDFKHFGKAFCTVYIYAYHSENIEEVPQPFLALDEEPEFLTSILQDFEITDEEGGDPEVLLEALINDEKEDPPSREELFTYLVRNILTKHGKNAPATNITLVTWNDEDQEMLMSQIHELEVSALLEHLVLREWEDYLKRTQRPNREFFVQSFFPSYHHSKLTPFLPKRAQDQNLEVQKAYNRLLQMINSIQFFAEEDFRERIESEHGDLSLLKQCTTKFCVLLLHSDFSGHSHIDFWLDADIFEMLNMKTANTFLRNIYELTPGLGEQITCRSFTSDCEAWFRIMKEEAKYGDGHRVVRAEDPDKDIDL